jgi:hypothetical protein
MNSYGFAIYNTQKSQSNIISPIVTANKVSSSIVKFTSLSGIPSDVNVLFTMSGGLYYKSENGTVTLLAVNSP